MLKAQADEICTDQASPRTPAARHAAYVQDVEVVERTGPLARGMLLARVSRGVCRGGGAFGAESGAVRTMMGALSDIKNGAGEAARAVQSG